MRYEPFAFNGCNKDNSVTAKPERSVSGSCGMQNDPEFVKLDGVKDRMKITEEKVTARL